MFPESCIAKQEECAAATSSSGLVTPSASSAVRLGNETSYVAICELTNSTRPDPSCRVPVQAVWAERVAM